MFFVMPGLSRASAACLIASNHEWPVQAEPYAQPSAFVPIPHMPNDRDQVIFTERPVPNRSPVEFARLPSMLQAGLVRAHARTLICTRPTS